MGKPRRFMGILMAILLMSPVVIAIPYLLGGYLNIRGILLLPSYKQWAPVIIGLYMLACWFQVRLGQVRISSKWEYVQGMLGVLLFGLMNYSLAIPLLAYSFAEVETTVTTRVVDVDLRPGRRSRCQAEVRVDFDDSILSSICANPSFAERLKDGDVVEVSGLENKYIGIYVTGIRFIE